MQYIQYVMLGIKGIYLLLDIVKGLSNKQSLSSFEDEIKSFLLKLGQIAKVNELNQENLDILFPEIIRKVEK